MRFQAHIRYGSKDHYLGSFGSRHEAALASDFIARGYACQYQQQLQHTISATAATCNISNSKQHAVSTDITKHAVSETESVLNTAYHMQKQM
jgi:hypothetical protein